MLYTVQLRSYRLGKARTHRGLKDTEHRPLRRHYTVSTTVSFAEGAPYTSESRDRYGSVQCTVHLLLKLPFHPKRIDRIEGT
jgi:hypothetical protein